MGIFDDIGDIVGGVIGTVGGIAIAPLAIALGVSKKAIQTAIDAGCKTVEEIKEFLGTD